MEANIIPASVNTGKLAAQIEGRLAERLPKLLGYATPERARYTPSVLRQPYGSGAWLPLSEAQRAATIEANLRAQILAELRPHLAEEDAPTPAEEDTPAPAPAQPSRYVVACVAGCGTFHPATSGRPVVVACGAQRGQTASKRKRSIFDGYEGDEGTAKLIYRLRDEAMLARMEANAKANAPRRKVAKARKTRRRAVCSITRERV